MSEAHTTAAATTHSATEERAILTVACLAVAFASAQQFAFACLVPVGLLAVAAGMQSRRGSASDFNS